MKNMDEYLRPTYFIDSDNPIVIETANKIIGKIKDKSNEIEKAKAIFYWTRDAIKYDPYESFSSRRKNYKASKIIQVGMGWCVQKACVLAALARVKSIGIPSRLHFADIKNYQITDKLKNLMGTDIFIFHGYTDLYLNGKWVKATPAFNIELCEKFNHKVVEFDGINDSILPEKTISGEKHVEYIQDRGVFVDFPFDILFKTLHKHYKFV
ncbi:MAG: transglutaminase-like domain-containing protein [Candidatus Helarchaeota archaeon]